MAITYLGNSKAIDQGEILPGNRITTVNLREDGAPLEQRLLDITDINGIWRVVSMADPAWVESEDEEVAEALSAHYGCPIGRPRDEVWL